MAVFIYNSSKMPENSPQRHYGWACALVLVAIVLVTNIIGQILSKRSPR
jgi:ABC-type phosphate transport system permease subunit